MATNKFKRVLSIATAFLIAFIALAATLTSFSSFKIANAISDTSDSFKLAGYDYDVEYLLQNFGLDVLDGQTNRLGGRTVSYRLTEVNGSAVAENAEGYSEATAIELTAEKTSVRFLCVDAEYTFTVTDLSDSSAQNFTIYTLGSFDKIVIDYKDDISAFVTALETYAATLKTGDTFKFSELGAKASDVAKASHFDIDGMRVAVNYFAPGSMYSTIASGSKLSDVSFKINLAGEYAFYFIFTDCFNNTDSVDDLVLGYGGYYADSNDNGKFDMGVDDELIVPVFNFTVSSNSKPEVAVGVSEDAFLDLEYEIECFTITAQNYTPVYKLYYIDQANAVKKADHDTETDYIDAVLAKATDVTEILDTDSLTFKPTVNGDLGTGKGYYYVLLSVYDDNGYSEKVMSNEIKCVEEYKQVVPEKQFFKYNVVSIVFLSISAVAFIAIIVLLFIRPKKQNELETKE